MVVPSLPSTHYMRLFDVVEHLLWAKELVRIGWSVGVVPLPAAQRTEGCAELPS